MLADAVSFSEPQRHRRFEPTKKKVVLAPKCTVIKFLSITFVYMSDFILPNSVSLSLIMFANSRNEPAIKLLITQYVVR